MKELFTFIIIGKTEKECSVAVESLRKLKNNNFKILISTGLNPSLQRNLAAKRANGEYLIFLDNDSEVDSEILNEYQLVINKNPNLNVVGGPSIYKTSNHFFQNAVCLITSSFLGFGHSKSRYSSTGSTRRSNERELILSNLCIRRSFFLKKHGFSSELYPNEENEFLKRTHNDGFVFYHPKAIVRRESITNLNDYTNKLFNYGQGRANHFIKRPQHFKVIYTLPTFFAFYLFVIPFFIKNLLFFTPLVAYLVIASLTVLKNRHTYVNLSILLTLGLFFVGHISYGFGFLYHIVARHKSHKKSYGDLISVTELSFS